MFAPENVAPLQNAVAYWTGSPLGPVCAFGRPNRFAEILHGVPLDTPGSGIWDHSSASESQEQPLVLFGKEDPLSLVC